jgi:hypothetical protein
MCRKWYLIGLVGMEVGRGEVSRTLNFSNTVLEN